MPDYLETLQGLDRILSPGGYFFSFQDPLRYDSLRRFDLLYSQFSYYAWRVFRGDVAGGLKRWVRRKRGIYLADCHYDNVEYHVGRNGVDQVAIENLFHRLEYGCEIVAYFSTQNRLFQFLGEKFGLKNTFAVVAKKKN